MHKIAVLYARKDSIYKSFPFCDVYDIDRDARTYTGALPIVAHPPCRAWGRLKAFARPVAGEKDMARHAVKMVQTNGGVLEHPAVSDLFKDQSLPGPGEGLDSHGGFTFPVNQYWFGHKAAKKTWLYIVGINPKLPPSFPIDLSEPNFVCCGTKKRGSHKREISKADRERTPELFAKWLCAIAHHSTHNGG